MASQADITKRIVGAYSSWVVRVYCYIRFPNEYADSGGD